MADDELDTDEIRERCEQATEAPWADAPVGDTSMVVQGEEEIGEPIVPRGGSSPTIDDAEFIAHARQDIPALCDEVERLRSQLDDVRQVCEQLDADDWREGFAKGALEGILGLEGDDE